MIIGPSSFFLRPEEILDGSTVRQSFLLSPSESLRVTSTEAVEYEYNRINRNAKPGDIFYIYGPGEFFPPLGAKYTKVNAFLVIEPLGLYYFQPKLFFLNVFAFAVLMYYFLRSLSSI